MQGKTLGAKQLLWSFVAYLCAYFPVTALIERKMFVLKGIWPAIGTIAFRGLASGVLAMLLLFFVLPRFEFWRWRQNGKMGAENGRISAH
jgi:hypothetical protein